MKKLIIILALSFALTSCAIVNLPPDHNTRELTKAETEKFVEDLAWDVVKWFPWVLWR